MTNIEWTQKTWNPIVGCSIKSPGCTNCYAMAMAARIEAANTVLPKAHSSAPQYDGTTRKVNGKAVWTGQLALAESTLLVPLKRKIPTTWFVNSMGDLFHEDCPDAWIDKVFAVMALTPQHTYQVLTKRSQRMREYFEGNGLRRDGVVEIGRADRVFEVVEETYGRQWYDRKAAAKQADNWPLPNVWLGVSTERQQEADERIQDLLATPAAIRFISAEPLLGPIDLTNHCNGHFFFDSLRGTRWHDDPDGPNPTDKFAPGLDWIIVGGESGPDARPMHPDWARSLRNQCEAAGVPFFFKQWGSFVPIIDRDNEDPDWRRDYTRASNDPDKFRILNLAGGCGFHGERVHLMQRYSKAHAGRNLDGLIHDEYPEIVR